MRRLVIVVVAVLAVLLLGAFAVRAFVLRDTTEPIDAGQVARQAGDGARVYAYDTRGSEEATVLGTTRHDYPATTTITVREAECGGADLRWDALDERSERWVVCDGEPKRFDDVHSFFGRLDERSYACAASPGGFTCRREGTTRTDRVEDLGPARVEVDGAPVDARRYRLRTTMRGDTRGTGTTDVWLARDGSHLPLRVVVVNESATDTPIGTDADYRERFELRLRSREPLAR